MDYHQNARTTVWNREQMAKRFIVADGRWRQLPAAANVSAKTAA